jgi:hypothetical protein
MSVTPNFSWPLIENTDLVTNLPADFETFADAVDLDLAGLNGGTTGQVLTKDSATDLDFSWETAGGAGAGFTLLNAGGTALTGAATITVSGISDQERLIIVVDQAGCGTASSQISFRLNTDTGSNYFFAGQEVRGVSTWAADNVNAFRGTNSQQTIGFCSDNTSSRLSSSIFLEGGKSTDAKSVWFMTGVTSGSGSSHRTRIGGGLYLGSSAITSVSLISSAGNFNNGTIYVYGSGN